MKHQSSIAKKLIGEMSEEVYKSNGLRTTNLLNKYLLLDIISEC